MTDLIEGYDLHLQDGYIVVKVADINLANPLPVELVQGRIWLPSPDQEPMYGYTCEPGSILLVNTTEGITIQKEGEYLSDVTHFIIPNKAVVGHIIKKQDDGS